VGIASKIELAAVPSKDKEFDGTAQGLNAARETARTAGQAGQIVTQFGIVAFDTEGLALVGHGRMDTRCVEQRAVGSK